VENPQQVEEEGMIETNEGPWMLFRGAISWNIFKYYANPTQKWNGKPKSM
jgi:hypothetical protein